MMSQLPWAAAAVAIVYMMLHRPQPPAWQDRPPASHRGPHGASPAPSRMEAWMDFHGVMVDSELKRIGDRLKRPGSTLDPAPPDAARSRSIRRRLSRLEKAL